MILATSYSGATQNAIGSLVVTTDVRVHVLTEDQAGFARVLELLKAGDNDEAERMLDRLSPVKAAVLGTRFEINGNAVTFEGRSLPNIMAQYVMRLHNEGFALGPLERFADNLFQNPSFRAINECFLFIEANQMPITEDGCFIGYRAVTSDYKDIRTRTFDNSVGSVCEEPRNMVDEDPNVTWSNGLHVCSLGYINGAGAGYGHYNSPWVIVKVNPRDVVAVPRDYHNTKMRVCMFEVIGELDKSLIAPTDKQSYRETNAVFQHTDKELIAARKFKELGEKHRKRNDERGSGEPLTVASFAQTGGYDQYVAGYEGRVYVAPTATPAPTPTAARPMSPAIPGSARDIARKAFDDGDFEMITDLKRSKKVSLDRLGFTAAEQAVIISAVQAVLTPDLTDVATPAQADNNSDYQLGHQHGSTASRFEPLRVNPQYWNGYAEAWKTNPNNQSKM